MCVLLFREGYVWGGECRSGLKVYVWVECSHIYGRYFILSGLRIQCLVRQFIPFVQGQPVVRDQFLAILW